MSDRFTEIYEENAKMRGQLIELRDRLAAVEQPADPNVEAVRRKLAERAAAGLVKYGTDTTRADLSTADWLAHLQQELMDGAVYAERLLAAVEQERAIPARMFPIQRGPAIPWSVIGPCDEQAKRNHSGQNLETLARRGGLDCGEAIDVLLGQPWGTAHGSGLVGEAAINRLLEIVQQRVALTSPTPAPDPETGLAACPCCNGPALVGGDVVARFNWKLSRASCSSCGLTTANHETIEKAREAWNRRAALARPDAQASDELAACYSAALKAARAKAYELGYALALHGSETRDLDLVAVPWTDEAVAMDVLVPEIARAVGGMIAGVISGTQATLKPHGRVAWTIILKDGPPNERTGLPFIDLSVMPLARPDAGEDGALTAAEWKRWADHFAQLAFDANGDPIRGWEEVAECWDRGCRLPVTLPCDHGESDEDDDAARKGGEENGR
jgi:hypothetical protein